MAESDTILQLGIEAAREGNREEARNLFSLLTRQEPNNVQGWLWLAGVADDADERRGALERVVELDPNNEMARRGLQAMGVSPTARTQATTLVETPPVAPAEEVPVAPAMPERELSDDERLAAELDMAYDDYDTVERVGPGFRNEPTPLGDERADDLDADAVGASSARGRRGGRRYDADDANDRAAGRRRPLGLLLGLVAAIALLLIVLFWVVPNFINRGTNVAGINNNANVAGIATSGPGVVVGTGNDNTNTGAVTGANGLTGTGELTSTNGLTDTGTLTGTNGVTLTGNLSGTTSLTGTTTLTGTAEPTAEQPTAAPVEQPTAAGGQPSAPSPATGNLASANPQPVPAGESVQAGNWAYTFPNFCLGSCATVVGKQIGSFTAQGNYVVALVLVSNNTGTAQPVPQDFFVVKDAQGNVYTPLPQVSTAYLIRGVNADRSLEDAVPAGVANTSIPLVFDIPSGASNLILFSSANPNQGFQIVNAVP